MRNVFVLELLWYLAELKKRNLKTGSPVSLMCWLLPNPAGLVRNICSPPSLGQATWDLIGHCWQHTAHSWVYMSYIIFRAALVSVAMTCCWVKPLCKHEGLQTHSVLLSRASGHLFPFPMTTLVLVFAAQKNTSICSSIARQGRGVALEIQVALVHIIKCAKRIILHYPQFQQVKCSPY